MATATEEDRTERSFSEEEIDRAIENLERDPAGDFHSDTNNEPVADNPPEETLDDEHSVSEVDDEQSVDAAATEPETLGDGGEDSVSEWYDDPELVEVAQSYEIGVDEIKEFGSRESLERAMRLIDKQLVSAPAQTPPPRQQQSQNGKHGEPEKDPVLDLNPDDYDEETAKLIRHQQHMAKRLQDQEQVIQQSRVLHQQLQQAQSSLEQSRALTQFHEVADTLDTELFGRTVDDGKPAKLNKAQEVARQELWNAAEEVLAAMYRNSQKRGVEFQLPSMPVLLKRAQNYAFSDHINKQQRTQFREKVAAQSKRRRPVPSRTRRSPAAAGTEPARQDDVKKLLNDPDVAAFFDRASEDGVG